MRLDKLEPTPWYLIGTAIIAGLRPFDRYAQTVNHFGRSLTLRTEGSRLLIVRFDNEQITLSYSVADAPTTTEIVGSLGDPLIVNKAVQRILDLRKILKLREPLSPFNRLD